jgi:protein O-mannosyl-transferase
MKRNKKNKQTSNISIINNSLKIYLLLVVVPLVLYFRVVNFNFVRFDDVDLIINNYNIISNLENIPKAFTTDAFFSHQTSFYRPLQTVSFMIDSQISGQNPVAYHFTNLILHILIVIVLFIFLTKIGVKKEISFLLSFLYSVHPILTSSVCWIPARGDLFLALFGLSSFIAFINYYSGKEIKFLVSYFFLFLLSCFSKETAFVFPLLLLFYFYYVLKKEKSWKEIYPFLVIWAGSFIIYFFFRNSAINLNNTTSANGFISIIKDLPAIPITLGKFFIPQGLTTMPLFNNMSVIIGLSVFLILTGIIVRLKLYNSPVLTLGIIWFLGFTLLPLYYRVNLAEFKVEYFEHRAGLPVIGLLIITAVIFNALFKLLNKKSYYIFIPVSLVFIVLAFYHSEDYSEPMPFFNSAIKSGHNNAGALNSRGNLYFHMGDQEKALADYESAIKICSFYSTPYYSEGNLYHSAGNDLKAEYYFSQALKYDTLTLGENSHSFLTVYNLAGVELILKKYKEAIILLKKAIKEFPANSEVYNNLGYAYYSTARYDSAIYSYSKAIDIQPNTASYYTNRGLSYSKLNKLDEAGRDWAEAKKLASKEFLPEK